MRVLDEIKYQVEIELKRQKHIDPAKEQIQPKDKILFLTKLLYEKKNIKEACRELQICYSIGKSIWLEHCQNFQNKTKKLYKYKSKKHCEGPSSVSETLSAHHEMPKYKCALATPLIQKSNYNWINFNVRITVGGQPVSSRSLDTRIQTIIKF